MSENSKNFYIDISYTHELTQEFRDVLKQYANLSDSCKKTYTFMNESFSQYYEIYAQLRKQFSTVLAESVSVSKYNSQLLSAALKSIQNPISQSDMQNLKNAVRASYPSIDFAKPEVSAKESDFVTLDSSAVDTYVIPESMTIPFGTHRVKIKTDLFVTILWNILSLIVTITLALAVPQSPTESLAEEQVQSELLRSQNQLLQDLLKSLDTSNSSQAKLLEELKIHVEEQDSAIDTLQSSLTSIQQALDNINTSEDTNSSK